MNKNQDPQAGARHPDSPLLSHPWDLSCKQARIVQENLAGRVITKNTIGGVRRVAGIDVGYQNGLARAAVVVLEYPGLKMIDYAKATSEVHFPYVPGFLSFREGPAVMEAMKGLSEKPDILIFDGQGLAHPRRLGIASHIGLLLDMPSIGCAKSRLCGKYEEPGREKGSRTPLTDQGETIGMVLRTRTDVKPVFVSIGNRIDLKSCVSWVLNCCTRYKLPETTRMAHRIAGQAFSPDKEN
jgi:deoxyribonuclease V